MASTQANDGADPLQVPAPKKAKTDDDSLATGDDCTCKSRQIGDIADDECACKSKELLALTKEITKRNEPTSPMNMTLHDVDDEIKRLGALDKQKTNLQHKFKEDMAALHSHYTQAIAEIESKIAKIQRDFEKDSANLALQKEQLAMLEQKKTELEAVVLSYWTQY